MLILVATPIGNLKDITLRALEALRECDLILCEDTRTSLKLLNHYEIKKPLQSYHLFNEKEKLERIIEKLKGGKKICLISDAGTPLICDPGSELVKRCYEEKIEVTAMPGACALIQALTLSPFPSNQFQFIGFLGKAAKELLQFAEEAKHYPGITIAYEAPHRILKTLKVIEKILADTNVSVARELTKKFETLHTGTAQELVNYFEEHPPKGECVLLVYGKKETIDFSHLSPEEHVNEIEKQFNISRKEAIKIVASLRKINKRELYSRFFGSKKEDDV